MEPVPELYATLASLTHRTRTGLEELGALEGSEEAHRAYLAELEWAMQERSGPETWEVKKRRFEFWSNQQPIRTTPEHLQVLEDPLLSLERMSIKELEGELHLATGGINAYHELWRPQAEPLDDLRWRQLLLDAAPVPWICEQGLCPVE